MRKGSVGEACAFLYKNASLSLPRNVQISLAWNPLKEHYAATPASAESTDLCNWRSICVEMEVDLLMLGANIANFNPDTVWDIAIIICSHTMLHKAWIW
jgi:hypothetical protein